MIETKNIYASVDIDSRIETVSGFPIFYYNNTYYLAIEELIDLEANLEGRTIINCFEFNTLEEARQGANALS